MSDTKGIPDIDLEKRPHKSILKRIDIGLMTGLSALLLSFVGVMTSCATLNMNQQTQKARVLPIIDIDMGYLSKPDASGVDKQHFEVTLNNVGAGIAHVQSVTMRARGEQATTYESYEGAIMTGRMLGWTRRTEKPATGYIGAGQSITPSSYRMGAAERELSAYLRGEWGTPLDRVDLDVCYCSVFNDCWTVSYLDRKAATPVSSCAVGNTTTDIFQNYIDQRTAARLAAE